MDYPFWKNANFVPFLNRCFHSPEMLVCYIKRQKSFFHNLFSRSNSWGYIGTLGLKKGYRRLQGVTRGYKWLQGVKRGYKELQGVTRGYKGLQGVTGFKGG